MARGRFISKEISLDQKVASLSDDTARLLFTWLIPHLDCEGRMYGESHLVKAQVFPRSKCSIPRIEKYLREMVTLGLIIRYSNGKESFIFKPNFEKHQLGLRKDKEAPSSIPARSADMFSVNGTEGLPTNVGATPPKDKVSKENRSISKDKVIGFGKIKEEIRAEFQDLNKDFDGLFDDCVTWWSNQKRELKDPKRALRNWLRKERGARKMYSAARERPGLGHVPDDAELDKEGKS